jgi:hypothetical protein
MFKSHDWTRSSAGSLRRNMAATCGFDPVRRAMLEPPRVPSRGPVAGWSCLRHPDFTVALDSTRVAWAHVARREPGRS